MEDQSGSVSVPLTCSAMHSKLEKTPKPQNLETFEYEIESRIGLLGCDDVSTQVGCEGVGDGGIGVTYGCHSCDVRALGGGTSVLHTIRGHVGSRSSPEGCFVSIEWTETQTKLDIT